MWFIIQNNALLLLKNNNDIPNESHVAQLSPHLLRSYTVQEEVATCAEVDSNLVIPDIFHVVPLKNAFLLLDESIFYLAIKAYVIIRWDRNHQFCSACGKKTSMKSIAFERICIPCQLSFFPRISPSIIVLIKKEDKLLMARGPHFPPGVYGLIAGFVEAWETLEEAVHREVKEEVGLSIKNVIYYGSQPWPFPDSLMIAFTADYAGGDIVMNEIEIEAAGWFKHDNLPGRPSIPSSIAASLIDDFIRSCS